MFRALVFSTSIFLSACAGGVPSNFIYETSLRGEQGFPGRAARLESAKSLLAKSGAADPKTALQAALPDADIKVKRWGLKYFGKDWTRYQLMLDADIEQGDIKIRCREVSSETPVGAPVLDEILANDGVEFGRQLEALIETCVAKLNAIN